MTHRIQKPTNRIHSALLASLMLSGAYLAPSAVLVIGCFAHNSFIGEWR